MNNGFRLCKNVQSKITMVRDAMFVVFDIINVAKRYDIYNGEFKEQIKSLRDTLVYSAPEVRIQPEHFMTIFQIMSKYFPIPPGMDDTGFYKEFKDIIKGN